eukprot:2658002-Amphidinium_carterae.1
MLLSLLMLLLMMLLQVVVADCCCRLLLLVLGRCGSPGFAGGATPSGPLWGRTSQARRRVRSLCPMPGPLLVDRHGTWKVQLSVPQTPGVPEIEKTLPPAAECRGGG